MFSHSQKNIFIGILCAIGCETLFGLSYVFTKSATATADVSALLGWRFFIAAVLMSLLILFRVVKINRKKKSMKPLMLIAFFNPCFYFLGETFGISHTTASESGVFLACIPVASLIASTIILKKRPSKLQVIGILITLMGVLITIVAIGIASSLSVIGYMSLFGAVIAYALYSVYVEKATAYTGMEITYVMLLVGAVVFCSITVIKAMVLEDISQLAALPFTNHKFAVVVIYQGIGCSVGAFFLSNIAIRKLGVNRASTFIGLATVVSILAGAFVLEENFSLYQIIGTVIIIAGVYTANARTKE